MRDLAVGSLFSGIGGLDLGLERAGLGSPTFFCEADVFCRSVLARHWPEVSQHDDVRTLDGAAFRGRIDAIVGGFPCQDVSVAGKGVGLDGARSGLWREMHRIIAGARPALVVIENVPALRSRGADRVLGELEALGYAATPLVVGAEDVGAPHRRKRVFIVAHGSGGGRGELRGTPCAGDGRDADGGDARGVADAAGGGRERATDAGEDRGAEGGRARRGEPERPGRKRRVADPERHPLRLLEQRVPARRARGVRHEGEAEPRATGAHLVHPDDLRREEQRGPGAAPAQQPRSQRSGRPLAHADRERLGRGGEPQPRGLEGAPGNLAHGRGLRWSEAPNRWPAPPGPQHEWEPPRILTPATTHSLFEDFDPKETILLNPDWVECLMGFPVGWTRTHIRSRNDRLRALGNAVVPQVAEVIGRAIVAASKEFPYTPLDRGYGSVYLPDGGRKTRPREGSPR